MIAPRIQCYSVIFVAFSQAGSSSQVAGKQEISLHHDCSVISILVRFGVLSPAFFVVNSCQGLRICLDFFSLRPSFRW